MSSTFQAISTSDGSQFITNSCKECICVDFQVSSNRYQWREKYIPDDEQVCWECKHKALSHRWERGDVDFPTDTMFVGDGAESDPYEGPIRSSPLKDLHRRRSKSGEDSAKQDVEYEYNNDAEGKGSPFQPIGIANSPVPKPTIAKRRKAVSWAGTIEKSPQRSPAVNKTAPKSAGGQLESREWDESPRPGNAPSPPLEGPGYIPTEPKVPTGRLTLTGIMEYLVSKNQYDTWERRISDAKIHLALSKIQEDLACVKGKLGSILDDDFASGAMGPPGTPWDDTRSRYWDYSEAQRMVRSRGPSPMSSPPVLSPNTEPLRAIPDPFIMSPRPSSAPSLRHWRDDSEHAIRQTTRVAPPSLSPGPTTTFSPIGPTRMTGPQVAKQGKMVIREEIDENYDSYDSGETEVDEPSGSKRPGGAPANRNNSMKPEDSQVSKGPVDSDGSVSSHEDKGKSFDGDSITDSKLEAQENRRDNGKSVDHESPDIGAAEYVNSRRQQTQEGVGEEEDGSSSPFDGLTEEGPSTTPIIHMHSGILPPPLSTITEEFPARPFTVYMDPIVVKKSLEIPPLAPPTTRQDALLGGDSHHPLNKPLAVQPSEPDDDVESLVPYSDLCGEEIDEQESTTSEYMDQTSPRKYSTKIGQSAHPATDHAAVALRRSPRKFPQDTPHPKTLLAKRARDADELEIETPRKRTKTKEKSSKPLTTKRTKTPGFAKATERSKAKLVGAPARRVGISSDGDNEDGYTELSGKADELDTPTRRAKITPKITSQPPKTGKGKSTMKRSTIPARAKSKKRAARKPNEQTGELNELEMAELDELSFM